MTKQVRPSEADPVGPWRRAVARLVDLVVVVVPTVVVLFVLGVPPDHVNATLAVAFAQLAYFLLLESRTGTTAGKRLLGIQVVDRNGHPPDFGSAAKRNAWVVLQPVAGPPSFIGFAFLVWTAVVILIVFSVARHERHRGLHDRWAEAIVVRSP